MEKMIPEDGDRTLFVCINNSVNCPKKGSLYERGNDLYEATRKYWPLARDKRDNITCSTLLKKNLVTPDIEYSSTFHLVNKNYRGIEFDEVDVYDSDTVRCLTYQYTPQNLEKAKEKYDQITSLFYKEIGNAAIDTSYIEKEAGLPKKIRHHETTWIKDKKKYLVSFTTHDWLFDDDSYFLLLIIQRDDRQ